MHPFSILTLGIFVAGYITARWDLVTRLYELAIFAWDHGVVVCLSCPGACESTPSHFVFPALVRLTIIQARTGKGFLLLSVFFFLLIIPINVLAAREEGLVSRQLRHVSMEWLLIILPVF